MPLNLDKVRSDFPILSKDIIYFDSAASSLTPEPVLNKMLEYYHNYRANIARGIHQLSQRASEEYEKARNKISGFINARSNDEIIMTKNTSDGINIVANGLKWRKGDNIVTTSMEHHSNFVVWLRVKERYGVEVKIIFPNKEGILDITDFEKMVDDKTRLIAVTHTSNVLGTVTPVEEITQIGHNHGAYVLVDGAQSVPHMRVDVQKIDCDFLAFSGHKMCGPTGIGVLYSRKELQEEIEPISIGGGTVKDVNLDCYNLLKGPKKFEVGTPSIAQTIGLGAAVDYLQGIGMQSIRNHDIKLVTRMYDEMTKMANISVYGPEPKLRTGIFSFNIEGLSPHDVALAYDTTAKIMIRSGAHCALPLMKEIINIPSGTARASTYLYNTFKEVDKFIDVASKLSGSLS